MFKMLLCCVRDDGYVVDVYDNEARLDELLKQRIHRSLEEHARIHQSERKSLPLIQFAVEDECGAMPVLLLNRNMPITRFHVQ